jgi:hypothetical protein
MNFIEGGQLDEVVRREPIPIRRAVELIAKVARTVHYAPELCGSAPVRATSTDRVKRSLSERSAPSGFFQLGRKCVETSDDVINKTLLKFAVIAILPILLLCLRAFTGRESGASEIPRTLATEPEHTRLWIIPRLV